MATHPPIRHQSKQHSGKVEDQQKLEHSRINVGTPPTPATKTAGPQPRGKKGDSADY